MATYTIEALDTGGNVVATTTVTATGTTNLGTVNSLFPALADGDYTFRAFTPETGAYTIVTLTAPATMSAPTLTGGTESASLTLGPAPDDGGDPITSYSYEVTDSTDTGFASPVAQGTQTSANLGTAIDVSPLTADDYIARQRATNSAGSGAWSSASAAATVTAAASSTTFTRDNVIASTSDAGRTSTNTLKTLPDDSGLLPAGADWNGSWVTITGDDVVLEDWLITRLEGSGSRAIIRQCEIQDTNIAAGVYPLEPSGPDWLIEHNNFIGTGIPVGAAALIVTNSSATGIVIKKNHFIDFAIDGMKINVENFLVEQNIIGPAKNGRETLPVYDSEAFYSSGTYVSSGSFPYQKISEAPAGTPLSDDTAWSKKDPHTDHITVLAGSGTLRYNYLPDQGSIFGATQFFRATRNSGTSTPIGPVLYYGNVSGTWSGAQPYGAGTIRPFVSSRTYQVGEFSANGDDTIFFKALNQTTTDPASDMTDWEEVRDINVNGEFLWAHNWLEPGSGGQYGLTGGVAPVTTSGNKNEAENSVIPRQVLADIQAPANVGDDLPFTNPVFYGPAQVFTVTPTDFSGSLQSDGETYTNVCVVRVGIQAVAWIKAGNIWYVSAEKGVTVDPNGDGSFTLRIYDSSGNPMSGSVSIPAGAATVVSEADEVTTGPAWGTEPTVVLTNDVQNLFAHTSITAIGQTDRTKYGSTSDETLSLEGLGLQPNDIAVGFVSTSSTNNRFPDIITAGYTENYTSNTASTWRAETRTGYKTMPDPADTSFTIGDIGASGIRVQFGLRAYRAASTVAHASSNGSGLIISPPQVDVTVDNSVVLVIASVAHGEGGEVTLTESYLVNTWEGFTNDANSSELSTLVGEIERNTGLYTPPDITINGATDLNWVCQVFVLSP